MADALPAPLIKLRDCRYGRMLFLTTDKFIGRSLDVYGEYGHSESAVFAQIVSPGHVVVEVGANIGAHTVQLAQLVGRTGRVLAFEPQRVVLQILCANLALNELLDVHTYHAGSGRRAAPLKVPNVDYRRPDSNFGGVGLADAAAGETVEIIPLDKLDLTALRLVKIDVEGMELDVLEGARRQIARHRPVIYVENDRREQSPALIALLDALGYEAWWHVAYLFNPENFAGNPENIFAKIASINLLCLPREQEHTLEGFRKVVGPDDWWENPPRR